MKTIKTYEFITLSLKLFHVSLFLQSVVKLMQGLLQAMMRQVKTHSRLQMLSSICMT